MSFAQIILLVVCCVAFLISGFLAGFLAGQKSTPIIGDLVDTEEGFYLSFNGSEAINKTRQKKVVSVRCIHVE